MKKHQTMKKHLWVWIALSALPGCSPQANSPGPSKMARTTQSEIPTKMPARPALGAPIDRMGRSLTANALIGPIATDEISDSRKEAYNRAAPGEWVQFSPDIQASLALYDGLDGQCGNQWFADRTGAPSTRYRALAKVLADDRLWIDSEATVCKQYLSVELSALGAASSSSNHDCGGRTPTEDAIDVFRSLLANGTTSGIDDGVAHDDREHSTSEFPFLAAP